MSRPRRKPQTRREKCAEAISALNTASELLHDIGDLRRMPRKVAAALKYARDCADEGRDSATEALRLDSEVLLDELPVPRAVSA